MYSLTSVKCTHWRVLWLTWSWATRAPATVLPLTGQSLLITNSIEMRTQLKTGQFA